MIAIGTSNDAIIFHNFMPDIIIMIAIGTSNDAIIFHNFMPDMIIMIAIGTSNDAIIFHNFMPDMIIMIAIGTSNDAIIFHNFMPDIIIMIDIGSTIAVCRSQGMNVTVVKTNPGWYVASCTRRRKVFTLWVPTRGSRAECSPPYLVTRPAVTFAKYVCTIKLK